MQRIFAHTIIALFAATTAFAQEGEVLSFLDGDWNQDDVPDRAYLMAFPDTGLVDLAIYIGDQASGELRLASHMQEAGLLNGLDSGLVYTMWGPPILANNDTESFHISTENAPLKDKETLTIYWQGDGFAVGKFQRDLRDDNFPENAFTCIADYRARKGTRIATATGEQTDVPVSNGAVSVENWELSLIPEACIGY